MRYIPGWVLNGVIAEDVEAVEGIDAEDDGDVDVEDVEVTGDVDAVEAVEPAEAIDADEAVEVAEEDTRPRDCCCCKVDTFLSLCAAESPPATPPLIAAPNIRSATTNVIQNVRIESPHIRCVDVSVSGVLMM
jgi:hypothetical protein